MDSPLGVRPSSRSDNLGIYLRDPWGGFLNVLYTGCDLIEGSDMVLQRVTYGLCSTTNLDK